MQENSDPKIQSHVCLSCGNEFAGKFCNLCGEKKLSDKDSSIAHFLSEFFHILSHADSKFLKSLKFLLIRPGFVASEFLRGRRKLYTVPLTLFFIGNLVYYLIPLGDSLSTQYHSQIGGQFYSASVADYGEAKRKTKGWTEAEMERRYNSKAKAVAKLMMILLPVIFSIFVGAIFFKKQIPYFTHLIYATEFFNFVLWGILIVLAITMFIVAVLLEILNAPVNIDVNSPLVTTLLLSLMGVFLSFSAKQVYRQQWIWVIPKAFVLTLCAMASIFFYRFVQFFVTIWVL